MYRAVGNVRPHFAVRGFLWRLSAPTKHGFHGLTLTMSRASAKVRLASAVFVAVFVLAGAGAVVIRWAVLPWALGAALKAGGASEVTFELQRATPWLLQVADVGFNLDAVKYSAAKASLARSHWWLPSLGALTVKEARIEVDLDQVAAASPAGAPASVSPPPKAIPLEEISVDGRVVLHVGNELSQTLVVAFAARAVEGVWHGEGKLTAPGLAVGVVASYGQDTQGLGFKTTEFRLDLQPWQKWIEHWAPLPGGPWELAGGLTGEAAGEYRNGKFLARGDFHLRDTRLTNAGLGLTAEGVEGDIDVADLTQLLARKATLRVKTVTVGKIVATDLAAEFSRTEGGRFDVAGISGRALGGSVSVEPFVYRLGDTGAEAVVRAESIRAEEVMALTENLPALASGALSGRLPIRYDADGLKLGTGWLGLAEGASVEIQFHAAGLLTAGTSPKSPSFAVLKKVEDGILKLNVTELRLDIRPPNAPPGRTAQLHVVGAPVDPQVKAPVTLDLNVNGPIESLLNLGLKSATGGGTKP
jgi:hypothetical protein